MNNTKLDEATLDALLEEVYGQETVEKSEKAITLEIAEGKRNSGERMEVTKDKEETADEAMKKVKSPKSEKEGSGGRSKDVHDVPDEDEDGNKAKGYEHIQAKQEQTPDISDKGTMVKSQEAEESTEEVIEKSTVEISAEEYAQYEAFKKSQEEAKAEELKKAQEAEEAEKLEKAIAASGLKEENAELRKSLEETQALIKSLANKPVQRKSVFNVQAIEKSFSDNEGIEHGNTPKEEKITKSQMLDAAEALVKAKVFKVEDVIELENTGFIANGHKRKQLEAYFSKK